MKKILTSTLLAATVLGAGLAASGSASAADGKETSKASTNGSVTFIPGSGVDPVDPTKPEVPTDPGDGNNGGTEDKGPLAIVYATDKVSFGLGKIEDKKYVFESKVPVSAKSQDLQGSNFISLQVGDVRGTSAGWILSVSADQFTSPTYGELGGATLTLGEGENVLTGSATGTAAVSAKVDNVIGAGGTVLSAAPTTGAGLNADKISANNMTLTIPAGSAKVDTYTTTLNWSLKDVPA
ncbi:WxL domain-containing protein [Dellaglioa algida]|uniref:Cell surface protein n=1 Tax=Dellaglioa algida TaxID=105612 RepID=A0A5C6M6Z0_9LACO|nr:WxL domain-containing protein [Dellaglioa algida]MDK1717504.1 WxL domain-containing protein [Dellaglioa algida]MDK1720755.1 WxL domain-containing protein [Dellaglioa algida]MDK1722424.1 WxL domain-containing protein [Dellaglioa algida]MDK1724070.1 WxL domain-containing protein [Dellaglioa algida]MDK1725629.1 WxL domain-containing protein [Dellaglioa algida]